MDVVPYRACNRRAHHRPHTRRGVTIRDRYKLQKPRPPGAKCVRQGVQRGRRLPRARILPERTVSTRAPVAERARVCIAGRSGPQEPANPRHAVLQSDGARAYRAPAAVSESADAVARDVRHRRRAAPDGAGADAPDAATDVLQAGDRAGRLYRAAVRMCAHAARADARHRWSGPARPGASGRAPAPHIHHVRGATHAPRQEISLCATRSPDAAPSRARVHTRRRRPALRRHRRADAAARHAQRPRAGAHERQRIRRSCRSAVGRNLWWRAHGAARLEGRGGMLRPVAAVDNSREPWRMLQVQTRAVQPGIARLNVQLARLCAAKAGRDNTPHPTAARVDSLYRSPGVGQLAREGRNQGRIHIVSCQLQLLVRFVLRLAPTHARRRVNRSKTSGMIIR